MNKRFAKIPKVRSSKDTLVFIGLSLDCLRSPVVSPEQRGGTAELSCMAVIVGKFVQAWQEKMRD